MPSEYMTMSGKPVEVPPDETPEERRERERDLPMFERTQEFGLLPGVTVDMGPANRDPDFTSSAPWRREGADPSEKPEEPDLEPEEERGARLKHETEPDLEPELQPQPKPTPPKPPKPPKS